LGVNQMSLIHSCGLCDANASDNPSALQQYAAAVKAAPTEWWRLSYRDAIASFSASP
jgi:hypothetical protein